MCVCLWHDYQCLKHIYACVYECINQLKKKRTYISNIRINMLSIDYFRFSNNGSSAQTQNKRTTVKQEN